MARMIDMIRNSAVPVSILRTAAKGALSIPPDEMIEILVQLSTHPLFGEQARATLSTWDVDSARVVCSSPATHSSVLKYFLAPQNRRSLLITALASNPSVGEEDLMKLASEAGTDVLTAMMKAERVKTMPWVLKALAANSHLASNDRIEVMRLLGGAVAASGASSASPSADTQAQAVAAAAVSTAEQLDSEDVLGIDGISDYEREHAHEIEAEKDKQFELVMSEDGEHDELAALVEKGKTGEPAAEAQKAEPERLSVLQKIARMTVGQRVQLAMKGSKDERFVLIRDGSKVVSLAVLESPKLSDAEMETFASMKNVQQAVLRGIASKRRFMKQYSVIRALANNPRCPMDIALSMLPHLLVNDLRALSKNKNVSDTIRKIGLKMYKEKTETRKGS